MSLLFEDLFKKFNSDFKKEIDKLFNKKVSKAMESFDLTKIMKNESITNGKTLLIDILLLNRSGKCIIYR